MPIIGRSGGDALARHVVVVVADAPTTSRRGAVGGCRTTRRRTVGGGTRGAGRCGCTGWLDPTHLL
jgi:hypothetical protein